MESFTLFVYLYFIFNLLLLKKSECADITSRRFGKNHLESLSRVTGDIEDDMSGRSELLPHTLTKRESDTEETSDKSNLDSYTSLLSQNVIDSKLQLAIIALLKSKYTTLAPNKDPVG